MNKFNIELTEKELDEFYDKESITEKERLIIDKKISPSLAQGLDQAGLELSSIEMNDVNMLELDNIYNTVYVITDVFDSESIVKEYPKEFYEIILNTAKELSMGDKYTEEAYIKTLLIQFAFKDMEKIEADQTLIYGEMPDKGIAGINFLKTPKIFSKRQQVANVWYDFYVKNIASNIFNILCKTNLNYYFAYQHVIANTAYYLNAAQPFLFYPKDKETLQVSQNRIFNEFLYTVENEGKNLKFSTDRIPSVKNI